MDEIVGGNLGARRSRVLGAPCKLSKGSRSAEGGERKLQNSAGKQERDTKGRFQREGESGASDDHQNV